MATGKNSGKTGGTRKVSATSKPKPSTRSKTPAKKPAAKRTTTTKSKAASPRLNDGQRSLLAGIIILFLTAVLTLSLLSPNQGQFTEWLSRLAALAFGIGTAQGIEDVGHGYCATVSLESLGAVVSALPSRPASRCINVWVPTLPSAFRPLACWNFRTRCANA